MSREMLRFREIVWEYYAKHGRDLPWRKPESDDSFDPYKILVSEIMLQQTQVARVIPKYQGFLQRFPTIKSLADASLATVLAEWNGLGYNRRAKFLHEAAKQLTFKSEPWAFDDLVACKGIGPNTAAAVLVYTYNQPLVFIETNIRSVFIHHFFSDQKDIPDEKILPILEAALGDADHRKWYWALMDYGVYLKASFSNPSRQSKHYAKQSAFVGSKRQLRGQVLRLLKEKDFTGQELIQQIPDERLGTILSDLLQEKLISKKDNSFYLG